MALSRIFGVFGKNFVPVTDLKPFGCKLYEIR